ncbi:MAG: hypothetical protein ACF8GE_08890 [Phycisphaerales bacterium JB043]
MRTTVSTTTLLWLIVASTPALAQESEAIEPEPASSSRWSSSFELDATSALRAQLDTVGHVQASRTGATWNLLGQLDQQHLLNLSTRYEASLYDISGATGLSPDGDVIDSGHQLSLTAMYTTIVDSQWSWILGGVVSLGFEDGADTGDALTGGGFLIARQQYSKSFSWMAGLGVISRLEDDALIFPYLGIDWAINETTRLHSEGTSVRLDSRLRDDLTVYSAIGWTSREFRLDDSNSVAGGVFQEDIWSWSLGVETLVDKWTLRVEGGLTLSHRIEIFNSGGASTGIADADPTGYVGLSLRRPF